MQMSAQQEPGKKHRLSSTTNDQSGPIINQSYRCPHLHDKLTQLVAHETRHHHHRKYNTRNDTPPIAIEFSFRADLLQNEESKRRAKCGGNGNNSSTSFHRRIAQWCTHHPTKKAAMEIFGRYLFRTHHRSAFALSGLSRKASRKHLPRGCGTLCDILRQNS